jgi:hypothetical protein
MKKIVVFKLGDTVPENSRPIGVVVVPRVYMQGGPATTEVEIYYEVQEKDKK